MPVAPLPSSSPTTTNAASASRASRVSRTVTERERGGAPSSTTSAKAPLRSRMSAHHAPRARSFGRTTRSSAPAAQSPVQPRGSSVRVASTQATRSPRAMVALASWRTSVVRPLPSSPTTSVSRPFGIPRPGSTASSAGSPVARLVSADGGTKGARGSERRSAGSKQTREVEVAGPGGENERRPRQSRACLVPKKARKAKRKHCRARRKGGHGRGSHRGTTEGAGVDRRPLATSFGSPRHLAA
jgi:hypothetical protein